MPGGPCLEPMAAPPAPFRERLAELPPAQRRAFVADLWRARGHRVAPVGERRLVRQASGAADEVAYVGDPADPAIPDDVAVVVTSRAAAELSTATDARVVGPTALYRQLAYAIEPADREDLLAEYFEGALTTDTDRDPGPTGAAPVAQPGGDDRPRRAGDDERGARAVGPDTPGDGRRLSRRAVLIAGGAVIAGVGSLAVLGSGGDTGRSDTASPATAAVGDREAGATPTPRPTEREPGTATPTEPRPGGLGISGERVSAAGRLVAAHRDRLSNTSYRLSATKTVVDGTDRVTAGLTLAIALSADRGFLAFVTTRGPAGPTVAGEPPVDAAYWSDTERYLRRRTTPTGTDYGPYEPAGELAEWYYWSNVVPFGGHPQTVVSFYRTLFDEIPLRVAEAGDAEGTARTLRNARAGQPTAPAIFDRLDPDDGVTDLDLRLVIDPDGLIRSLSLAYEGRRDGAPRAVTWTVEYAGLGNTSVAPPPWYERSVQASATRT